MNWPELPVDQLLQACVKSEVSGAWEEFIRRFHVVITAAAVRVSRHWGSGAAEEIDDIIQEIYLKFCADRGQVLAGFRMSQPDAIYSFIKTVATNTARDFYRRQNAAKRGSAVTQTLDEISNCARLPVDIERQVTLGQLHDLLDINTQGENGSRDRAIFRFYYRDGMTAQAISQLPGVRLNPKGVEGVLHRLTSAVRKSVGGTQEIGEQLRSQKGGSVEA
jgi:RNA polymerase sigma-70 factor (ECF subfamily)